jgi:hypothetical protein
MNPHASNIDRQREQIQMQLISSRAIAFLDSQSLAPRQAREALFRTNSDRFVLYLTDGAPSSTNEERLVFLELREALIWLNEPSEQRGSFWT